MKKNQKSNIKNQKYGNIYYTSFSTSIGRIYLAATEKGICRVSWGYRGEREFIRKPNKFKTIKKDILKYLSGEPAAFKKYAVVLQGTDFQKKVWRVLSNIPYGKTLTYKQVAEKIGAPTAFRAVGGACGANELPIIIPCHRVVAGSGSLGGFSGGLKLKRYLLKTEGVKIK